MVGFDPTGLRATRSTAANTFTGRSTEGHKALNLGIMVRFHSSEPTTKRKGYMQTFLPYKDFERTARVLDYKRLGKQRVEARQIINILEGRSSSNAWKNHPAVKMWYGYVEALKYYFNVISQEWVDRVYKHTMGFYEIHLPTILYPVWLGNEEFHKSHRSNLLRKDSEYYGKYFKDVKPDLPYFWPYKRVKIMEEEK